jgi:hypothetical protein
VGGDQSDVFDRDALFFLDEYGVPWCGGFDSPRIRAARSGSDLKLEFTVFREWAG